MKRLALLCLSLAAASPLAAQCPPYDLTVSTVAPACSASGAPLSTLKISLQTSPSLSQPCKLVFGLDASPYCCNIYITARLLAIGFNPTSVPLPGGCELLVTPDIVLAFAPPTSGTYSEIAFGLPVPSMIGLTATAEAAVVRFDTIAFALYVDTTSTQKFALTP